MKIKSILKVLLIVISILVAIAIGIATILFTLIYFFTSGTPWTRIEKTSEIRNYLQDNYQGAKFDVGYAELNFLRGDYVSKVTAKIDGQHPFTFEVQDFGNVIFDGYLENKAGQNLREEIIKFLKTKIPRIKYKNIKVQTDSDYIQEANSEKEISSAAPLQINISWSGGKISKENFAEDIKIYIDFLNEKKKQYNIDQAYFSYEQHDKKYDILVYKYMLGYSKEELSKYIEFKDVNK